MAVLCEFTKISLPHGEQFDSIEIKNQIIPANREPKLIESFQNVKINNNVLAVKFSNCIVTKVSQGLTKIFPNLKILIINNSKLKKISKSDLAEYKNLEKFICEENDIEFLPGDLFEGFENLEFISFSMNKLKDIAPNILDGLTSLKHVNFKNNPKFNKYYSIYPVYNPNATLDDVKNQIFEKYYSNIENVKNMMQKYEQEIQNLKKPDENSTQQEKSSELSSVTDSDYSKLIHRLQTGIFGDLEAYILNESTKDFLIQIDDRVFPVHKFLLAARSPTLAEILKNNPEVENLNLVDISVEIFEIILKFLYTDELPDDDGTKFMHLFVAAGKLKIEELKNYAGNKVIEQIDDENALEILNLSNRYKIFELREKAFEEIKKKYSNIEMNDEWAKDPEKLARIIQNYKMKEEAKRKYEEEIRTLDEQFQNTMTN